MVSERPAAGLPTAIVREIGRAHNIPAAVGGRVVLGALMEPVRTMERLQECFRLHRADDDRRVRVLR